jgi:hypothetical protein
MRTRLALDSHLSSHVDFYELQHTKNSLVLVHLLFREHRVQQLGMQSNVQRFVVWTIVKKYGHLGHCAGLERLVSLCMSTSEAAIAALRRQSGATPLDQHSGDPETFHK